MRRYQPALLGGLFIGVLSSLPVVNIGNLCCCLWVVAGGVLTAYLQQQNRVEPLEAAEAALGGLLAGLIGALLSLGVTAIFALSGDMEGQLRSAIDEMQIPPEVRDRVEGFVQGPALMLLIATISLPVYAIFGMLGALLGLAIFRKKTPPAVSAPPPPPPPPPPPTEAPRDH
jgi:hypothetical protein